MLRRTVLIVTLLLAMLSGHVTLAAETGAQPARRVMTWIPPYAIAESEVQLNARYGPGPRRALTHIALQFWRPGTTGDAELDDTYGAISAARIKGLVAWGHRNGIKVVLCVFNAYDSGWDWPRAENAFAQKQQRFIKSLTRQMVQYGLDGIDVDLEAPYDTPTQDRASFTAFIAALTDRVHALNGEVSIASFPYIWNAPNKDWWPDLLPIVDAIASMGYQDIGRAGEDWRSYAAQQRFAGRYASKLMLGMPADRGDWQGSTAQQQVDWVASRSKVGVAIWDAQLPSPAWRTADLWRTLRAIRVGK